MKKEILEAAGCCVQCNAPLYDCRDCGAGDPLKFAKAIVDHHDKYGWRDLRKYPNDLPKTKLRCLCKMDNGEYVMADYYPTANQWYTDIDDHYYYGVDVIAWREIEPFEPADHCPNDYHGGDC